MTAGFPDMEKSWNFRVVSKIMENNMTMGTLDNSQCTQTHRHHVSVPVSHY